MDDPFVVDGKVVILVVVILVVVILVTESPRRPKNKWRRGSHSTSRSIASSRLTDWVRGHEKGAGQGGGAVSEWREIVHFLFDLDDALLNAKNWFRVLVLVLGV